MWEDWPFISSVCFSLRVKYAFLRSAAPYLVLRGCSLYVILPSFFNVQHCVVCVIRLWEFCFAIGGWAPSGTFHLFACLRAACPCSDAMCPVILLFDIYLLCSRNFGIRMFHFDCYILFSIGVYICFGRPVPWYVLLSIISLFCYLYMDYFHFHNGISFGWEVPLYF